MADAFVTPSISEVHPLSVIEAQASGLAVLGIHSPGVGDIVEDGVTGILAQEEDLALFTDMMIRFVTNKEDLQEMGEQARDSAQKYAIEKNAQTLLDHYQRLNEELSGCKRSV